MITHEQALKALEGAVNGAMAIGSFMSDPDKAQEYKRDCQTVVNYILQQKARDDAR